MAKKSKSKKFVWMGMTIVFAIVIIVLFAINFMPKAEKTTDSVAAILNGEKIFMSEVDDLYERGQFSGSKYEFLTEVLIPQKLLLQEADDLGITVSDDEVQEQMNLFLTTANMTREEFDALLEQQGLTFEELRGFLRERLILDKLAEQIISSTEVSDEAAEEFYNENQNLFLAADNSTVPFEDVKEDIKTVLAAGEEQTQLQEHIDELKKNAEIKINKKVKE